MSNNDKINIKNINSIFDKKMTIKKLKEIAKQNKIKKISKLNKKALQNKIYGYLKKHHSAYIIQEKFFKRNVIKKILRLQGPARLKRQDCINDTDFYDLDKLTSLSWINFISFIDENNHMFGFTLKSLYNLYLKNIESNKITLNPYNTQKLPHYLYSNLSQIIKLCKLINIPIDIEHNTNILVLDNKSKVRELFTKIDELGNYSDPEWLLKLNKCQLILYIRELKDIFFFRADISGIKRFLICPFQNGDPFYDISIHLLQLKPYNVILDKTIDVIKRFIMYSSSYEHNKLGSLYVLIALTLVSEDARSALPELYYSVNLTN